MFLTSL